MKRLIAGLLSGALILSACGKDETEKLNKDIKELEADKKKVQQDYDKIKSSNKDKDKAIAEKEKELDDIAKQKEEEIKKQIALEAQKKAEAEKAAAAKKKADALKQKEAEKKQQEKEKKEKAKRAPKKEMPNTIEASTRGKASLVFNQDDVPISLEDGGMKVELDQLQIFKVTEMPPGQVLLFDGKSEGYVVIYQVTTENTTDKTLYYNNNTLLTAGDEQKYSDLASFIPSEYQEMSMKKSETNFNEYAPHEKTTSYKSIVLSSEGYKLLTKGKAQLVIQGGIASDKEFKNKSDGASEPYTFKQ